MFFDDHPRVRAPVSLPHFSVAQVALLAITSFADLMKFGFNSQRFPMHKISLLKVLLISIPIATAFVMAPGCNSSSQKTATSEQTPEKVPSAADESPSHAGSPDQDHGHKPGAHGGNIVSLGRDSYHVEAIVEKSGALKFYMLGKDESRVVDIEAQDLVAYVKPEGAADSIQIDVKPRPQSGDAPGRTSLFVGQLPDDAVGKKVDITIPNITIAGERFRMGFSTQRADHAGDAMPEGKEGAEARELYLTSGGVYTAADIEANGNITAPQKFKGMTASHDLKPAPGDKICPVTLTKANPKFSWIVGGKTYEFCCPPCIDEFVALAKTDPSQIKEPNSYVKDGKREVSKMP
jgi:hypothetical protein